MFALESLLGAGGNVVAYIYRRFAEFFSGGDSIILALFPFVFCLRSIQCFYLLSKISLLDFQGIEQVDLETLWHLCGALK